MAAELIDPLKQSIIEGNRQKAVILVRRAIEEGLPGRRILQEGLIPGIQKVGELFSRGEYYLPELLVSGKAMQACLEVVEPLLSRNGEPLNKGKFLLGTVKGDIHDIGKNIVGMMLKSNGWEVTDLGVDIAPERFCAEIKEKDFDVFGISALLTVTMPAAAETIEALKREGLRDRVKIMIGGAPVTQEFSDRIGADEYARDAWEAVTKAKALLEKA